jgi:hypothetical protein
MSSNGDSTTWPKAFADLTESVSTTQLPGGTPTGTGAVVMNTSPTIAIGTGGAITTSGSGTVAATHVNGVQMLSTGSGTVGKIPIDQGNGTSVWSDPLVQGTQAEGSSGTTVNPVRVCGVDGSGNLKTWVMDSSGRSTVNSLLGVTLTTLSAQGTSLNSAQTIISNSGAEAVLVQLTQTTTITAGAVTFEFSYDGSTWSACPANDVVDPTSTTFAQIAIPYTCQASTNKQFLILMNGAQGLRIRTSTAITGTGSVTPNYTLINFDPLPSVIALSPTAANFNVTATPVRSNQTTTAAGIQDVNIVGSLGVTNSATNGTFIAITDNTTKAGVIAGTTALKTDQSSQAGTAITTVPTAFGTGTPSGNAPGVQAALYVGTTACRSNQTTTATGVQDVNIVGSLGATNSVTNGTFMQLTDNTTKVGVIAGTTALKTDMSSVAGTATVTAAAGVQKVGLVGNANATLDAAIGGAASTNALWNTNAPATASAAACTTGNAASLTVLNIKASAGNVYGVTVVNKVASVIYLQFYNTAGTPTLGTSVISWIPIAASGVLVIPPGSLALSNYATGIGIGASTTPTSTGTPGTAPDVTIWFK